MELSKQAIWRSLAAWKFFHVQVMDELARLELDSPEVEQAIWTVYSRLFDDFEEAAEAATDETTEVAREEYERAEAELVHHFRRIIAQRAQRSK